MCFPSVTSTKFILLPICLSSRSSHHLFSKVLQGFETQSTKFGPKTQDKKGEWNKLNFVKFLVKFVCQKSFIVPKPAHSVTETCT